MFFLGKCTGAFWQMIVVGSFETVLQHTKYAQSSYKAIENLTAAIQNLTKAWGTLAAKSNDMDSAINELYFIHAQMVADMHGIPMPDLTKESMSDPIDQITRLVGSSSGDKKKLMN